ncbi:MAG TPA: hypothetical protein VFT22_39675 [Kofleriaceae bacterium]|nr:hypothetical protein [Kofleriaceae bacterium]
MKRAGAEAARNGAACRDECRSRHPCDPVDFFTVIVSFEIGVIAP